MTDAKEQLLGRVMDDVAEHGLGDRSLREIATEVGSSHRMLLYHFGSREGLITEIVTSVESAQRDQLTGIAKDATDETDLLRGIWSQVSDEELRPFVKLFFEVLSLAIKGQPGTEGFLEGLSQPWLDQGEEISERLGLNVDETDMRLSLAVGRGLLIEVLATGSTTEATESLERFLDMWGTARA
ncbi:MAG: TetR family transcriptional regulator [Acidimicrobiia bacterium]|nr:TetR family transcriptional regulator [Acidimicrobiia bacterium]